ncbi:MAG TPA: GNAT family N-acetyltransferase [Ilumatobacteraceae bacterium]|nr:GNAT family N-acetyltransferase [Ilumatobacteraceae bacterium]
MTPPSELAIRPLDRDDLDQVAALVAREHQDARNRQPLIPATFGDPRNCHDVLMDLLADGYVGVVAFDGRRLVGVMCGRVLEGVGFVPAHGLAVESEGVDPTAIVVRLFGGLAPSLLDDGATRFTIDHVALDPVGAALSNVGFGRGSVFGTQVPRPIESSSPAVDVRIATLDDLDAIAELSQIELTHRSAPPIYDATQPRTLAETRVLHQRLFDEGAIHFLARCEGDDVGLLTVEFSSPAPRLCPQGQPYIGPTATHPSARNKGVGTALVLRALDWADSARHETVSVDFDSANPLSRPFWLGLGFQSTGYRLRRSIDVRHQRRPRPQ